MSIFNRSKGSRAERDQTPEAVEAGGEEQETDEVEESAPEPSAPVDRSNGPWDVTEVEGRDGRLDLGALWMRGLPDMELRLEVDQQTQVVNAATAVIGDSALQLQAFAAPRTAGLWDDIRSEIGVAVEQQGGTVEEHTSDLGAQLRTRMPSAGPDGRTVFAPATFVGVDGPRWFLRGVLSGRAAIDESAAAPLLEVFRAAVVVRGTEPMAPRELLPLSLPRDVDSGAPSADDTVEGDDDEADESTSLNPFERGPEITEVR